MTITFQKYEATGNDFVIIDNRKGAFSFSSAEVKRICDRKFGVGADGLMLIENDPQVDFSLLYYNADGSSSLCGNGSRAAVKLASTMGLVNGHAKFNAFDGVHEAELLADGAVRLRMNDVKGILTEEGGTLANTGSPHFIKWVDDLHDYPVYEEGKKIRYSTRFGPAGTNVNFVQQLDSNSIFVRTYERGVENETLSCGTGVTAAALAASGKQYVSPIRVKTLGGNLLVEFEVGHDGSFANIFLTGPAKMVFKGILEL